MNRYYFRKFINDAWIILESFCRGCSREMATDSRPSAARGCALSLLRFCLFFSISLSLSFSLFLFLLKLLSRQHFRRWKFRPAASERGASPIQRPCAYSARVEEGRLPHFTVDYRGSFHGKRKHTATVV